MNIFDTNVPSAVELVIATTSYQVIAAARRSKRRTKKDLKNMAELLEYITADQWKALCAEIELAETVAGCRVDSDNVNAMQAIQLILGALRVVRRPSQEEFNIVLFA